MADSIYLQLSLYSQPLTIIFGTIGAVLNLVLFRCRKQLRVASCSLYFQALSANDLIVLYFFVLPAWLSDQFGWSPQNQYNWHCKIKTYLSDVFYTISPYLVVLACVDRFCTSSTNARLRRIATVRVASFLIPCSVIIIFVVFSHVLIGYEVISYPTVSICATISQTYGMIIAHFLLIFFCLLPPLLMVILSSSTYILLRRQRRRIMPINQARLRQRDNQMMKMLLIYVTLNIICILPFSIAFVLAVYNQPISPALLLALQLLVFQLNLNYSTSFYAYTLSTPFYRDELYQLIKTIQERLWKRSGHVTVKVQPHSSLNKRF